MPVALQVIALTAFLLLAQEGLRRAGKRVAWALFLVAPVALTPYWCRANEFGLFVWVKVYTVCFCMIWGTALRYTCLGDRAWARFVVPLSLAVNILEATVLDALDRGLAHKLNAVAGGLLVATVPYRRKDTSVDAEGRHRDIHLGLTRGWVVGYTLWNWTFVSINYPAYAGYHTAVLLSALVVGLIDPRRWSQVRACTLGTCLLATATFNAGMVSWLDTSDWFDAGVGVVAAGITLAFVAGHSLRRRVVLDSPPHGGTMTAVARPHSLPEFPCLPPRPPQSRSTPRRASPTRRCSSAGSGSAARRARPSPP